MPWPEFLNKAFKRDIRKKVPNTPNPTYFTNALEKKLDRKKKIKINELESRIKKLIEEKYTIIEGETFEEKKAREVFLDRKISELEKQIESFENNKPDPVRHMENRLLSGVRRDQRKLEEYREYDKIMSTNKAKDFKFAVERLISMRYLSRNPEIKERQMRSLAPWMDYFKNLPDLDLKFAYTIIRTILEHTYFWLDQDDDGNFDPRGIRVGRNMVLDFPVFLQNETPLILSSLREYINLHNISSDRPEWQNFISMYSPEYFENLNLKSALDNGDIRRAYYEVQEMLELSRINPEQIKKVFPGTWSKEFSFSPNMNTEEKMKIAYELAMATRYSEGFCIKSPSTAFDYLNKGKIALFIVPVEVEKRTGEVATFEVPMLGVHLVPTMIGDKVLMKEGEIVYSVNPKEVHGNAPGQGIDREYLGELRKWLQNSDFYNKESFEGVFDDCFMYENVKDRVESYASYGEDLDVNELKFLYQLYRRVTGFELPGYMPTKMSELVNRRLVLLQKEGQGEIQRLIDISKIFNFPVESIFKLQENRSVDDFKAISGGAYKVLVGDLNLLDLFVYTRKGNKGVVKENSGYDISQVEVVVGNVTVNDVRRISNIREITGSLKIKKTDDPRTRGKRSAKRIDLSKVEKIGGVELTDIDRKLIASGRAEEFPLAGDSRVRNFRY